MHTHKPEHLVQRFVDTLREGIHHGHIPAPIAPPPRTVPPAPNWPEWDWESKGGNGYEHEAVTHDA